MPISTTDLPFRLLPVFCIGAVASFALPIAPPLWLGLGTVWVCVFFCYVLRDFRWVWVLAFSGLFFAGATYALWRTDLAMSHRLSAADSGQVHTLTFQVADLPGEQAYNTRFRAKILAGGGTPLSTVMLSDYRKRDWAPGSVWQAQVRLNTPVGSLNPTGFNREAWALGNGIDAFGNIHKERTMLMAGKAGWLMHLRQAVAGRIKRLGTNHPQGAALVAALTLGVRSDVEDAHWQAFRYLGMTHLVSISGLHVGMVAAFSAMLMACLLRVWAYFPKLPLPQNPKAVCILTGLVMAVLYALLAGFSVPTQRSVVMIAAAALALLSRRFFTVWQIWWCALAAVLLFDPLAVLSTGFWLSFALTAALIFSSGSLLRLRDTGKFRLFAETQYAATIASVLPMGLFFAALPLLSPFANAIGIPWFSVLLTPLALLSLLCPFDGLLSFIIGLSVYTLDAMTAATPFAPMLPVTRAPWGWMLLTLIATAVWLLPRGFGLRLWAAVILVGFIFFPAHRLPENTLRLTTYDVGQGLSLLLQTRNHNLLFDTGKAGAGMSLIPSLFAGGVRRLDALVLSHNDNDHDGAADEIRTTLPVRHTWAGHPSAYTFTAEHCSDSISWEWDGVFFEFLTPNTPHPEGKHNDDSCVLRVVIGESALLMTGDLGEAGEAELVRRYGDTLYSQVLVLGHHGSSTSSSSFFLDRVEPQYAIVSAGFANSFSHPHPIVLKRLAKRNITVWRSDLQGAVRMDFAQKITPALMTGYRPYWQQKPFAIKEIRPVTR